MKLTFGKFLELNDSIDNICYVELTNEDDTSTTKEYRDLCLLEMDDSDNSRKAVVEKDTVISYNIATASDIKQGASENSICVRLLLAEQKQKKSSKRMMKKPNDINLWMFNNMLPASEGCDVVDRKSMLCQNTDCSFNKNGHCFWKDIVDLSKNVELEKELKVKKIK